MVFFSTNEAIHKTAYHILIKTELMIKIIYVGIILVLISCSTDDSVETNKKLFKILSAKTNTLIYDEINEPVLFNPNFLNKINFEYNTQNQIYSIIGGPVLILVGTNVDGYTFVNDVINEIRYSGDTIITENSINNINNPDIYKYVIKNDKLVFKQVIANSSFYYTFNYNYEYVDNRIIEYLNGKEKSIYFLTQNNLTKVEKFNYNLTGDVIIGKQEMFFSNYDESINLLKNHFFINGAFYKSFSDNNYNSYEIKEYSFENNQYILINTALSSFNYTVDSNNIPNLFDYEYY